MSNYLIIRLIVQQVCIPQQLSCRFFYVVKAHCKSSLLTMRALELIVGTMSRAHCSINPNEGNNEPNNEPNNEANSCFLNHLKRRLHPSHS